jgi:hypothetical protein
MRRWIWLGLSPFAVGAALFAGCAGEPGGCALCGGAKTDGSGSASDGQTGNSSSESSATDDSGVKYVALDTDGEWGTVSGQVVWGGDDVPERTEINVGDNVDKEQCLSKGKLYDEKWVVNKENKGIRWVFVWLQPVGSGSMPINPKLEKADKDEVTVDQPCCQFVDHAIAMRAGQALVAKNSASVAHNVKWFNKDNPEGNVLVRPGGSVTLVKAVKASNRPMSLECNIHGWMKCWVRIFDHPYYALTDADGKFEIKLAPAGKYRLLVWNEEGWGPDGKDGREITIKGSTDAGKVVINPSK